MIIGKDSVILKNESYFITEGAKKKTKFAINNSGEGIISKEFIHWIKSYKDLPCKINQWGTAFRAEKNDCIPFLRSKYFFSYRYFLGNSYGKKVIRFILPVLRVNKWY